MEKKRILLVEDDKDTALGLSVRLKAQQYEVAVAQEVSDVYAYLFATKPDLILLDIGLPGMDGFKMMAWLHEEAHTANVPVIVVSARDPATARARMLGLGARAYFQKPADNAALLAKIQECLGVSG